MHNGYGYDGGTWWWIPMTLMMVAFWGGLIWLGVALLRRPGASEHSTVIAPSAPLPPNPQQILAERLARGEIEPDDYRTRLEALTATHS